MADGINKVFLLGYIDKDPEVRSTNNGQDVANFTLSCEESWEHNGQTKKRTEWARCVAWGDLAELVRTRLARGDTCFVEGRMQTRKWEDRNGQSRYITETVVSKLTIIGSGSGSGGKQDDAPDGPPPEGGAEDIPF